ncbi:MAG: hypothetical protein ACPGUV_01410, partial [Polyangiales bacterium]
GPCLLLTAVALVLVSVGSVLLLVGALFAGAWVQIWASDVAAQMHQSWIGQGGRPLAWHTAASDPQRMRNTHDADT